MTDFRLVLGSMRDVLFAVSSGGSDLARNDSSYNNIISLSLMCRFKGSKHFY